MLAQITHILPTATIVRKRLLPVDGQILVKPGQKVSASDTIAEAVVGRRHVIIDISSQLRLPIAKADPCIKVKRGQKVSKGDLLAESTGLMGKKINSPTNGRVVATGSGKVILETGGNSFELRSGLSGIISEIIPNRGATIRAIGTLIQGVWGNGRVDTGVMLSQFDKPDDILDTSRLDVSLRGSVLLAGHVADANVLRAALDLPLRGLILSSMDPSALSTAAQLPMPIILLEGFGKRPLNPIAFKLLTTNVKREISVLADMDRIANTRPELVIPLPITQEPPEPRDDEAYAPGQTVRVCFLNQPSRLGTLLQLRPGLTTLASGITAPAADVRFESGEQIIVPLNNLEVLG